MPRRNFLCLAMLLAAGCAPAASRTVIVVEAQYPGANAQTVADTIAAPIEQQVAGVENGVFLRSRSTNDGGYTLTIAFADGADAAVAQVLVQNRVALAMPLLPDVVKQVGLTVKKAPADVRFIVVLSSPKGRFDDRYLSNYAAVRLKDELNRLEAVNSVAVYPEADNGTMRIDLDRAKVAKAGLTVGDIVDAIKAQNIQIVKAPPKGAREGGINVSTIGRLVDLVDVGDIVIKADINLKVVRLRDLGQVERLGARRDDAAQLNGKYVALLLVAPNNTAAAGPLQNRLGARLAELRKPLPDDVTLELAFDFTANIEKPGQRSAPEYLLLDVDLPARAVPQRIMATLNHCRSELAGLDGVQDVLTLSANPLDPVHGRPGILVRLSPPGERKATREQLAATIRSRLHDKVREAAVRIRFPLGAAPLTGWGYPLDLAVHGPDAPKVRKLAAKLAERLAKEKQLSDVWLDRATEPQPQLFLDIDREQARKLGVAMDALLDTLDMFRELNKQIEDFKQVKVRNQEGKMIPLADVAKVRKVEGPAAVDRFDQQPMVEITANPAEVSLADARALCEKLAREVREELQLPADYRVRWVGDPPAK